MILGERTAKDTPVQKEDNGRDIVVTGSQQF
jgi:hypothetical protein